MDAVCKSWRLAGCSLSDLSDFDIISFVYASVPWQQVTKFCRRRHEGKHHKATRTFNQSKMGFLKDHQPHMRVARAEFFFVVDSFSLNRFGQRQEKGRQWIGHYVPISLLWPSRHERESKSLC